MEATIRDRLPQRALPDILTRTAYLLGWHHHFGSASGSDLKIRDTLTRYALTVFAHGTLLGPAQVAVHRRSQVSAARADPGRQQARHARRSRRRPQRSSTPSASST